MAIDTITPVADSILLTGDSVSFIVDDTYTTLTIEVETASGYEYAYDGALGGAQPGYTVSVVASGGRHTFTVTRSSGWNISPFNFRVVENETGSSATTTVAYSLTSENTFPQGDNPYNGSSVGTLRLTDTSVLVAGDVGELDFVGFTIASLGNGLVRITDTGGGGGGGTWGSITGTLADQTDLQAALDAKVTGPASVTDNHLVRFDGTTGKLVQDSSLWLGNNGSLVTVSGATDSRFAIYERASAPAGGAGYGDIWVKNTAPTTLWFTDDDSADHQMGDVIGPSSSVDQRLCIFDGTTGKLIADAGDAYNGFGQLVLGQSLLIGGALQVTEMGAPSTPPTGKVEVYAKTDGKLYIKDDAGTETDLTGGGDVVGPGSAVDARLVTFDGVTGKLISDSGDGYDGFGQLTLGQNAWIPAVTMTEQAALSTPATGKLAIYAKTDGKLYIKDDGGTETDLTGGGDVVGPASAINRTVPLFDGTTGKLLKDSVDMSYGGLQANTLALTGGTGPALAIYETAVAPTNTAAYGKFWVKNDTPTIPMFTDDASGDYQLLLEDPAAPNIAYYSIPYATGTDGQLGFTSLFTRSGITGDVANAGSLNLNSAGAGVKLKEGASVDIAPGAGAGVYWVKSEAPTIPVFTDDDNVVHNLNRPTPTTLASNELVQTDATEVVIGGGYLDGSTGGTFSWEILGIYNDNGGTGNQDIEVRLYDRGPDGTPVAGVLRSTIEITSLDTLDRVSQALTVASSPGVDADAIDSDEARLYEVRAYLDAGGGVDTAKILSVNFIES